MTQTTQPLPTRDGVAADAPNPSSPHAERLLALWGRLARDAAAAAAHRTGDELSLIEMQTQVEDVLLHRYPACRDRLAELTVLETTWIHDGAGILAGDCLICRKGALDLPLDLPFPAQAGTRR